MPQHSPAGEADKPEHTDYYARESQRIIVGEIGIRILPEMKGKDDEKLAKWHQRGRGYDPEQDT